MRAQDGGAARPSPLTTTTPRKTRPHSSLQPAHSVSFVIHVESGWLAHRRGFEHSAARVLSEGAASLWAPDASQTCSRVPGHELHEFSAVVLTHDGLNPFGIVCRGKADGPLVTTWNDAKRKLANNSGTGGFTFSPSIMTRYFHRTYVVPLLAQRATSNREHVNAALKHQGFRVAHLEAEHFRPIEGKKIGAAQAAVRDVTGVGGGERRALCCQYHATPRPLPCFIR